MCTPRLNGGDMNGIGMALLLILLATVAMSVWIFLPRSHRMSGATDLEKMGEALAGARDAQPRLADRDGDQERT